MIVVLPIYDGKIALLHDSGDYMRPAMGKNGSDVGKISEQLFGMHGFTTQIGGVHLNGEPCTFHTVDVKQVLPSTKTTNAKVTLMPIDALERKLNDSETLINIFLNLGLRMMKDNNAGKS